MTIDWKDLSSIEKATNILTDLYLQTIETTKLGPLETDFVADLMKSTGFLNSLLLKYHPENHKNWDQDGSKF